MNNEEIFEIETLQDWQETAGMSVEAESVVTAGCNSCSNCQIDPQ